MTSPEPTPSPFEPLEVEKRRNPVDPIVGWAKAIVFGIGDTAKDMLAAGREGAREATADGWDRFDEKTKHRRK
jgi:NADPH-dependent glutamate synthase beta subunit-like oxidoreductase